MSIRHRAAPKTAIRTGKLAAGMAGSGTVLDVDNAVQASIVLLAAEGGEAVAGRTQMRMMVFLLLKKVGLIAGKGRVDADMCGHYNGGDVDRELRRLSDAGAVRCGSSGIEATGEGMEAAVALGAGLDERTASILRNTKWFYNDMTCHEALVYTRMAYPDEAWGPGGREGGGQRAAEDVLIGLVGKGKITSAHVAELLRRDRADIMRMVSAAGIPVFQ